MEKKRTKVKKDNLTRKERLFCRCLLLGGNAAEAVVQAGYPPDNAATKAALLLGRKAVRREMAALRREAEAKAANKEETGFLALAGLRRLAFSSANDAARLVGSDTTPTPVELAAMDLFCVSDMKRTRDGQLEVKFFDRIKALEALLAWADKEIGSERGLSFYTALENSTTALKHQKDADKEELHEV